MNTAEIEKKIYILNILFSGVLSAGEKYPFTIQNSRTF